MTTTFGVMKDKTPIAFTYHDFNHTTSRSHDTTAYGDGVVNVTTDGVYITGKLGCGKIRGDIHEALREYLGGRRLVSYRVYD